MDILWVIMVIILGAFIQSLTGFGLALVSVPLLSLWLDAQVAIPLAGLFGWLVTVPIVWKMRQFVLWKVTGLLLLAAIPGTFLGVRLLATLPSAWILLMMGVIVLFAACHALMSHHRKKPHTLSQFWAVLAGFLSGALGGAVGEPGPPVIAYISFQNWSADQAKATLLSFFMLQMIVALSVFYSKGLLNHTVIQYAIWALPSFVIGMIGGLWAYESLKSRHIPYQSMVHYLLLGIGTLLVVKGIHHF